MYMIDIVPKKKFYFVIGCDKEVQRMSAEYFRSILIEKGLIYVPSEPLELKNVDAVKDVLEVSYKNLSVIFCSMEEYEKIERANQAYKKVGHIYKDHIYNPTTPFDTRSELLVTRNEAIIRYHIEHFLWPCFAWWAEVDE